MVFLRRAHSEAVIAYVCSHYHTALHPALKLGIMYKILAVHSRVGIVLTYLFISNEYNDHVYLMNISTKQNPQIKVRGHVSNAEYLVSIVTINGDLCGSK